ncbi:thioredoxin M-type, chloroplastic-like [Hibiscus syriacus]|uniref:thioredoxin M-type, chloroplastic-like n=1 Tax=Hibiscus syriacus TaxID=106335 RepID=UPI001923D0ED|nr:thioredoxin M-type, chloroplastic-like [Hibiscus syriacus]
MALKICFQLSSACNTRPTVLQTFHHHSPSPNNIHLHTFTGSKSNKPTLSFTSRSQKSRLVCKATLSSQRFQSFYLQFAVEVVTEANWDELVVRSQTPVLDPVIAELAKEYAGMITCYKLNTDSPQAFRQNSGPTVLFFKNGEKKESIIGAVSKSTIADKIEKHIDP